MKIIQTIMMKRYIIKLWIRIFIFLFVTYLYLSNRQALETFIYQPLYLGITPLHVLWVVFMLMMVTHLFPKEPFTMALLKSEKEKFTKINSYYKNPTIYTFLNSGTKTYINIQTSMSFH